MQVKVLFADSTYSTGSFGKYEVLEYGIINERDTTKVDVVLLTSVPEDVKKFPDIDGGWAERWYLRENLIVVAGDVKETQNPGVVKLDKVRLLQSVPARKIAEAVLAKAKEIEEKGSDNVVEVDKLKFTIVRFKPCRSEEDVRRVITQLYLRITGGRKRVLFASPAIIEVIDRNSSDWYVTSLPKVLHFARENPPSLAVAGIIDEGGFNAGFVVIKGMMLPDLGDDDIHVTTVDWINSVITRMSRGGGELGLFGGGEETTT